MSYKIKCLIDGLRMSRIIEGDKFVTKKLNRGDIVEAENIHEDDLK